MRETAHYDEPLTCIAAHLGQCGHIKVHKAKVLNRGLDTSRIKIRWSLGNEGAMPPED